MFDFMLMWKYSYKIVAEPPRKDSGELLLNKVFLDAWSSLYVVFPGGQDNQGQNFVSKHFNVIDPLRVSNNLGRSVSKGIFLIYFIILTFIRMHIYMYAQCFLVNYMKKKTTLSILIFDFFNIVYTH